MEVNIGDMIYCVRTKQLTPVIGKTEISRVYKLPRDRENFVPAPEIFLLSEVP